MADDKKKDDGVVTLLNRGKRHYDVIGLDGKPTRHAPGATMTYGKDEAEKLVGYSDLIDITKLPGQVNARALRAENETLKAEKERLEKQIAAMTQATGGSVEEVSSEKRSKKEKVSAAV